jgi:hypothetical protein
MDSGATVMFSVTGIPVITKYWALKHGHAKSTNFSSTIIPDVFGGFGPLQINCLALRNKFMTNDAVTVKKHHQHCLDVSDLPHFLQMWRGLAISTHRTTIYLLGCKGKPRFCLLLQTSSRLVIHNSFKHKNTNHFLCLPGSNLGANLVEIHQKCKSSLQIYWRFSY